MATQKHISTAVIAVTVLLFVAEQVLGIFIGRAVSRLLEIFYPSLFFWIVVVLYLYLRGGEIVDFNAIAGYMFVGVVVCLSTSLMMVPIYLPVMAFRDFSENPKAIDFYRAINILSVALQRAGWALLLLLLVSKWQRVSRKDEK